MSRNEIKSLLNRLEAELADQQQQEHADTVSPAQLWTAAALLIAAITFAVFIL